MHTQNHHHDYHRHHHRASVCIRRDRQRRQTFLNCHTAWLPCHAILHRQVHQARGMWTRTNIKFWYSSDAMRYLQQANVIFSVCRCRRLYKRRVYTTDIGYNMCKYNKRVHGRTFLRSVTIKLNHQAIISCRIYTPVFYIYRDGRARTCIQPDLPKNNIYARLCAVPLWCERRVYENVSVEQPKCTLSSSDVFFKKVPLDSLEKIGKMSQN